MKRRDLLLVAAALLAGAPARAAVKIMGGPPRLIEPPISAAPAAALSAAPAAAQPQEAGINWGSVVGLGPLPKPAAPASIAPAAAGASASAPADLGPEFDGSAPGRVWPVSAFDADDEPAEPQAVHSITARGDSFLIDGKRATELSRSQGGVQITLIHPADETLRVTIFHDPASLAGQERKDEAVQALRGLSAAGAAPKLVEHGETIVDGKGVVHVLVQEAVQGKRLDQFPPQERPLDKVGALFDRLAASGLELAIPGPGGEWLARHIVIGTTRSGGEAAYLTAGAVELAAPGSTGQKAQALALLTPSVRTEPEAVPQAPPAEPAPAVAPAAEPVATPAPLRDSPNVTTQVLEADAGLVKQKRSDAEILTAAKRLIDGFNDAPAKVTPKVHEELLAAVREYWAVLSTRKNDGHELGGRHRRSPSFLYSTMMPLDPEYYTIASGRYRGAARYSARLDLYRKLLEARADLAGPEDALLLRSAFAMYLFQGHDSSNIVYLAELTKLAGALDVLASSRPDLAPIGDYAAVLAANAVVTKPGKDEHVSDGRKQSAGELRKALEDGFVRAALVAPLDDLRQALLTFNGGGWESKPGFEPVVSRLASERPEFAAIRYEPAMPASDAFKKAAQARDPLHPVVHSLTTAITGQHTLELAVGAAERGWVVYKKALSTATHRLFEAERAKRFYIEVFALGQAVGSQSAYGPKVVGPFELVKEARRIATEYLGTGSFDLDLPRIQAEFGASPNHARKVVQTALLAYGLGWSIDTIKRFLHGDPRMGWMSGEDRRKIVLDELQRDIPALLKDFDTGTPSNIAGVLLAGSYAEGGIDAGSDLNLYLLTRDGSDRTADFSEALRKKGQQRGWPAIRIDASDVMPAKDPRVQALRRSVPTIVYRQDDVLTMELPVAAPYAGPLSWSEQRADKKWRGRLRAALEQRLK